MKKQLLRVEGLKTGTKSNYTMNSINFAFVSNPANGRAQATELMTCREYVLKRIWESVNNCSEHSDYTPIDLSKLRLLIIHDPANLETFKRNLFSGKAALNVLEKINGWTPSSIMTVKHPHYNNAWLLTGPAEWMSQPQLLSLATWVMRLAAKYGPIPTDNYDILEAGLFNMLSIKNGSSDVETFLPYFWDRMYIILKYYKEIFDNADLKTAWKAHAVGLIHVAGGMLGFISSTFTYSEYASFRLGDVYVTRKRFDIAIEVYKRAMDKKRRSCHRCGDRRI
jgi:hypothetical protein